MNRLFLTSLITLSLALIVAPLYAQSAKNAAKQKQQEKTEITEPSPKTNSPFYAGLSIPFGFTFTLGSFQTTDKTWSDNKTAFGASAYGGYKFNADHHLELFLSYMREEAVVIRSYHATPARSLFKIDSLDCAFLYRYNIKNYSVKIGPAVFKPDITETVYMSNSSRSNSVSSKNIVFGAFIFLSEYFKIFDDFSISLSLYAKIPFTNYTEENDKLRVLTMGLAVGGEYCF